MPFQVTAELHYEVMERSTVLLNIHALSSTHQTIQAEAFQVTPGVEWEEMPVELGENRYIRLDTGDQSHLDIYYEATVATQHTMIGHGEIRAGSIAQLARTAIPYLFPSRYCESDRLGRMAMHEFGGISHPYSQVVAISDWIFENIDYLSGSTDAATSAFDTVTQRAGVCRDFAHLGIAFCRALSIPARYLAGYACLMQPQDFHACFEAYIGDRWYVFDPTRLAALNGLVRIATGRDAADASVASIFGRIKLTQMAVSCTSETFQPLGASDLVGQAIVIDP